MSLFSKLFSKPSKEDILRFNYHSCFRAIPTLIEKYNEHKISFDEVLDTEKFHDSSDISKKLAKRVKTVQSGINGHPEVSLTLIIPPSNGMISEVEVAMIAHNSKFRRFHDGIFSWQLYGVHPPLLNMAISALWLPIENNSALKYSKGQWSIGVTWKPE